MKELQEMIIIINEVVAIFLQEVSISKTKLMKVIRYQESDEEKVDLKIKGEVIEEVTSFKYWSVIETATGKVDVEIGKRMCSLCKIQG